MGFSDDAVLELIFNPEAQGLPLDSISASVDSNPKYEISPETTLKLETLEKQAVQAAEKNDLDQALSLFNECITIEPNYASAYNNRAQLYRMQDEVEKAIADLDKVISDVGAGQPKVLRQAYTQRAILKRQQGDLNASREDFEMGAKLGNPVARNIAVKENPYAKMCNQVMMEVMKGELTKGLE